MANKKLEALANIITTLAGIMVIVVLARIWLETPVRSKGQPPQLPAAISAGANLKSRLPGVTWGGNGATVVLAISTHCHFCTESAAFYRRLSARAASENVRIVAVLPEPINEAQQQLRTEGVRVDQIEQAVLTTFGVRGTPTMLLVDRGGIVKQVWQGKLQEQEEDRALAAIAGAAISPAGSQGRKRG